MHSKSGSPNRLGSIQERCIIALNVTQSQHMHAHNYEDNISTHPKDDINMLIESVVAESQPSSGFYSMVNTMHFQLVNEDDMITKKSYFI